MKKLHPKSIWLFFVVYFIAFLAVAVVATTVYATERAAVEAGFQANLAAIGFFLTVIGTALAYIVARLTYLNYRYEVTALGFRKDSGIIWKHSVTIPYSKIQNIDIVRGVLARMLGLSDIQIQTAGASNPYSRGEGRLIGLGKVEAEALRDELVKRAK